ncbi:putative ribonuclease H protein [Ananas comosus]|uniref:Putative ribonuclease H protein n=1 Tax=Ananas comosus TaxID=4615 RepID=A0A199VP26_ANACO|nr:putative ribonuclease H protein [Ananas comosus]
MAPSLGGPKLSDCYPIWRDILSVAAPFLTSVEFQLGNGIATSFWHARWCGELAPRNCFPNLFDAAKHRHLSFCRFGTRANLGFPALLGLLERLELQHVITLTCSIPISDNIDYSPSWRWTNSSTFSVRSAYAFLSFDGITNSKIAFLWKLKIPLRIKIFLWLAARNKLLTTCFLAKRGWQGPSICVLCYFDAETIDHLLFLCPFARDFWNFLLEPSMRMQQVLASTTGQLGDRWKRVRGSLSGQ